MSFMRTLATVAVGFAAAKGVEKYKQMGGMSGLQQMMEKGGGAGMPGMGDLTKMAEQMGFGNLMKGMEGMTAGMTGAGGANPMEQLMGVFGDSSKAAGAAGLGGLFAAMQGAASAGGKQMDDMMSAMKGAMPATQIMEDNAKLMLRAMIQAAKADGEIDNEERAKILDALGDVDPEERAFVERELNAPLDISGLAQDTAEQMRAQVYATSLMAIRVDSEREVAYLSQLAQALGISPDVRDRMHAAMGVPPITA